MPNKTKSVSSLGGRPQTAVEVAPEGALAATIPALGEPPVYAFAALAPGALVPGVAEANIRTQEPVADAIRRPWTRSPPRPGR
jgi:hypothetical protein